MRKLVTLALLAIASANAEIVDLISVIVDRIAIKHSDLENQIRLSAFINGAKPAFDAASQKRAAGELIDQAIIRKELQAGAYPEAEDPQVEQFFQQVRKRYSTEAAFQSALAEAGLTDKQLRDQLRWQVKVLQFIRIRFGTGASEDEANAQANQKLFAWLDETRKRTRVVFREESLK